MVIPSHRMMIASYHIIIASYHSSIYRQHHYCHFGISFVPCMCCRDVHHALQTQRLHQPIVYSILHHGEDIQEPHRVKQPWAAPCHTTGNGPHLQRHQRSWHGCSRKPANDASAPHYICQPTSWQAHSITAIDNTQRRLHQPPFLAPAAASAPHLP